MGATLPAMARVDARRPGQVGSDVGLLDASDTFGAALGAGLSGLVLLRTLGTYETIFLAVALNLLVALGAWLLLRRTQDATDPRKSRQGPAGRTSGLESVPGTGSAGLVRALGLCALRLCRARVRGRLGTHTGHLHTRCRLLLLNHVDHLPDRPDHRRGHRRRLGAAKTGQPGSLRRTGTGRCALGAGHPLCLRPAAARSVRRRFRDLLGCAMSSTTSFF